MSKSRCSDDLSLRTYGINQYVNVKNEVYLSNVVRLISVAKVPAHHERLIEYTIMQRDLEMGIAFRRTRLFPPIPISTTY